MTHYVDKNQQADDASTHEDALTQDDAIVQEDVSAQEDALFDEHMRKTAHEMREQMQPDVEVLRQTVRGAYPLAVPVTENNTVSGVRKRNRMLGIVAAAAAAVLVVVGGVGIASMIGEGTNGGLSTDFTVQAASNEIISPASYGELYASLDEHVSSAYSATSSASSMSARDIAPLAEDAVASEATGSADGGAGTGGAEGSSTGGSANAGNQGVVVENSEPTAPSESTEESSAPPTEGINDSDMPLVGSETPLASEEAEGSTASDYSQTNTQVEGVDEADIVKTDGKNIYSLYSNEIIITEAAGENSKEISRITLNYNSMPSDMYVVGSKLVVMSTEYNEHNYYYYSTTIASIFDISDAANPVFVKSFGQDGDLRSSRLVGDTLYTVSTYYLYNYEEWDESNPSTFAPRLYEGDEALGELSPDDCTIVPAENIYILPEYTSVCYSVVTALKVSEPERLSELTVLGDTSTVYMNESNLFLAATTYNYYGNMGIMPLARGSEEIVGEEEDTSSEAAGTTHTNNSTTTRVVKLTLNNGYPELSADTTLNGNLLNQFSLDEYNGYLRLAMTNTTDMYYENSKGESVWVESFTANNLYILDGELNMVGSIEDLAPDERIYSARFTGDVGYMVTFRETDPLFSLDLSDPTNPQVMDALKIPGFSEYLHPYANGLLLGIGQNTDDRGWTTGEVKLSMFDVSDPYNILEFDKELINAHYSPALDNHKSVLIDAEKNIIGFEIMSDTSSATESSSYTWQNYYVIYGYDEALGFTERAKIALPNNYSESRALYIDDYLYIVCGDSMGIYDLATLSEIAWINN